MIGLAFATSFLLSVVTCCCVAFVASPAFLSLFKAMLLSFVVVLISTGLTVFFFSVFATTLFSFFCSVCFADAICSVVFCGGLKKFCGVFFFLCFFCLFFFFFFCLVVSST